MWFYGGKFDYSDPSECSEKPEKHSIKYVLKIKDNVDLKELEQLNFYYDDNSGQYKNKNFIVNTWNRYIHWGNNELEAGLLLFDLIEKGFVEKKEVVE